MVTARSVNRILVNGLLALVLIGGVCVEGVGGSPSPGNAEAAEKRLDQLTKILKLTTEQRQQIAPILVQTDELISVVRQDESLSQQEKILRTNLIIGNANRQIAAVLNGEQAEKFFREEAKMREGHPVKTRGKDW